MNKMVLTVIAVATVMAGAAFAANQVAHRPTSDEVDQAIDMRLHAMLVKLNSSKK